VEIEPGVRIRVKVWDGPHGGRLKPEFADVVEAARVLGWPPLDMAHRASRAAEALMEQQTEDAVAGATARKAPQRPDKER